MFIVSIILLIINIGIISFFGINKNKIKNSLKARAESEIEDELKKLELYKERKIKDINNDIKLKENEKYEKFNIIKKEILDREDEKETRLANIKKDLINAEEQRNLILSQKSEIINKELDKYKILKSNEIEKDFKEMENLLKENFFEKEKEYSEKEKVLNEKLLEYQEILKEFKKKREVINQEILRQKEILEKEDFYKINISENNINDIKILKNIEDSLKNKEVLNKVIYDSFIKKPALEMIKRVLNGSAPSGIYKITFIPTGEAYIGKSTNINKRWQEHLKSAYNLGTIAHSSLHTKMAKEGVWNFSFEMLEEVPKDKLSEREKYWINFYDTKNYGLNEREG